MDFFFYFQRYKLEHRRNIINIINGGMHSINVRSSLFAPFCNCMEIQFQCLEQRRRMRNLLCILPSCMVVCNENALIYIKRLSPSFLCPDITLFCYAAQL
jgi:hypothetical protein